MSFAIAIDPAEDAPLVAGVDGVQLRAELEAILADGKREHGALLKDLRAWLDRHQNALRARFEADHDAEAAVYATKHGLLA